METKGKRWKPKENQKDDTQHKESHKFTHGTHAGRTVESVKNSLISGELRTTDPEMVLDVVRYHGKYWTLNNRAHL